MVTLNVCNASRQEMATHIEDAGKAVTAETLGKEAAKYATEANLKKTLGVTGRGDASLHVGKEDYCSNGKYLMGGKDAVFELELKGPLFDNLRLDTSRLFSCDEIQLLLETIQDNTPIEQDESNGRFVNNLTGKTVCDVSLMYEKTKGSDEVTTSAVQVALYHDDGARFMVAHLSDPIAPAYPDVLWGDIAATYCRKDTTYLPPADYDQVVQEMRQNTNEELEETDLLASL